MKCKVYQKDVSDSTIESSFKYYKEADLLKDAVETAVDRALHDTSKNMLINEYHVLLFTCHTIVP